MKTRWFAALMAALLLARVGYGQDDEVESRLWRSASALDHENDVVRHEAEREVARLALRVIDLQKQFEGVETGGGHTPYFGHMLARMKGRAIERAVRIAGRIAGAEGAAQWLEIERAFNDLPPYLLEPTLEAALGTAAEAGRVIASRSAAREVVGRFVIDWNEMYVEGSEEQKLYDGLKKELTAAGPAAIAPLLEVLAVPSASTFGNMNAELGVTARMQVRAIFGLSFVKDPVAIPALYLHTKSISFTAAANAGAALQLLTGEAPAAPLTPPAREKLDAWWKEHRADYPAGTSFLVRRLVHDLELHLARERLGLPETAFEAFRAGTRAPIEPGERAAAVIPCLEMLTGKEIEYDPNEAIDERIARVSRIRAMVDAD